MFGPKSTVTVAAVALVGALHNGAAHAGNQHHPRPERSVGEQKPGPSRQLPAMPRFYFRFLKHNDMRGLLLASSRFENDPERTWLTLKRSPLSRWRVPRR